MRYINGHNLIIAALVLLAGCGAAQQGATPPAPSPGPTSPPAAVAPSPAATAPARTPQPTPRPSPTRVPTPGPNEFVNPVIDRDFPDPDALKAGDTYYVYATNSGGVNIQSARSPDLVTWTLLGDALPALPPWARPGFTWAPEVTSWDGGRTFVMYFTARDAASDKQCIGTATSARPDGPFTSDAQQALICQADQGGSIDASAFLDEDGKRYLLWKNDGNCCGFATYIYIQEVSADGLTLQGTPTRLITNDQVWEGGLVEAPTLWKHNGKYYLFYSANSYAGVDYAIGYAVADRPTGPYTKPASKPLLATDMKTGAAIGPGGQDIILDREGDTWMLYHSWDPTASYRRLMLDELVWEGDTPVVKGPNKGPQPKP